MSVESGVARTLGLRPGEGTPVGLAVAASFVASGGLMIGGSAIEALFFARYGVSKLPVMYLVLGATMFLLTLGFGALLGRLGRGRACLLVPTALAVAAVAGRLALAADIAWITQALWLLQGAAQFLVGLAVWGLAGLVTDTRQAKRFFPLIGAGSVLGYVVGGLVTKPLAAAIGTPNLLLVWVATLLAVVAIGARLVAIGGEMRRPRARRSEDGPVEQLLRGLRYARGSTLMRWMSVASVLFSVLFFSLYLPFSRAATTRYPDPDQLAGFFGLFFGLSTAVAFLLSLFATNRLLTRFGVPSVLLVLPLLYVAAFGVLTIGASFVLLAVFRFAQVAWLSGGAVSSWEAVINTVPTDRRDQTRAFLYGGPTQVGTVLAGLIALAGERVLTPSMAYGVGLVCAVLATAAIIGVRRAYPRELVKALREGRPQVFDAAPVASEPFGVTRAERSAFVAATDALADPDPRVRRVAAHVLGDLDPGDARAPLEGSLRDADPAVRATAVASLARGATPAALRAIVELAGDADGSVRRAVVDAVASLGADGEIATSAVRGLTHDADPGVRTRAAAVLAAAGDSGATTTLSELATGEDGDVRALAFGAMRGLHAPQLFDVATAGLADPVAAVRAEAAGAMSTLEPSRALDPLVAALADGRPLVREAVARALGELGEPAVAPVTASLTSPDRREGALAALEHLPLDPHDDEVRAFAIAMVTDAVENHRLAAAIEDGADDRRTLLRDSLLARSERRAVLGLRAAALGGHAGLSVALENLSVTDPAQRANALEVIESVGAREIVKPLLTEWDRAPSHVDPDAVFARLLDDPDDWIRACTDLAMQPTATTPDDGGRPMTRMMDTLSPMERVLFLRDVPLFSALAPQDLQPIAGVAEEHAYADGDTIGVQGEVGDAMHIIVSGEVSVVTSDADVPERVVATRSRGDVVGEMAVMTHAPRMATLLARGDVRVLSIARPQFEAILRERPETAIGVIHVLSERLAAATG